MIVSRCANLVPIKLPAKPAINEAINGDNKITADDITTIGNPNPDFTYGFGTNFIYSPFLFLTSLVTITANLLFFSLL